MAKKKEHVALTKCYYCLESDKILLAIKYNSKGEPLKDLAPLHGCVVDMEPCSKCADWMKKGIILIGIDGSKSDPGWHIPPVSKTEGWMPTPHRTGHFVVITEEAIKRAFKGERELQFAMTNRFMFIEHEAMVLTGLIKEEKK